MKSVLSLVAVLLLVFAGTQYGALGQSAQPAGAAAPEASRGKLLYNKYGCWQCHGYTASTGNAAILVSSPLTSVGFVNYLRKPRTAGMPTYSTKIVPDAEAADIYAFVKTNQRPPEARDIPLLQQIMNEK
jgi:mono/diheme cytochrome c family protein